LQQCHSDLDSQHEQLQYEAEKRYHAEQEVVHLKERLAGVEADDGKEKNCTKRIRRRMETLEEQLKSESLLRVAAEKKAEHASKLKKQLLSVSSAAAELDHLNLQVEALQKRLQNEGEARRKADERCESVTAMNSVLERRLKDSR
jgi:hypothetical protein